MPSRWIGRASLEAGIPPVLVRYFSSASPLGIPDILPQDFTDLPPAFRLLPYRSKRSFELRDVCHFYLEDYRFETF
ncbi:MULTISPECIES: hypothetical protein [unclassified Halomonas]|uniref:hypothetical protein n=1 Tax=unclassified Halomonas TaxID=2609666 RepID=UPI004033F0F4